MNNERVRIKCKECGDIIEGDLHGTLISCECKKVSVDQTKYYYRILGDPQKYIILNTDVTYNTYQKVD